MCNISTITYGGNIIDSFHFLKHIACVHAGIGQEPLNNILATLNIHPISNDLWTRRLSEVSPGFTRVAKQSVAAALQQEKEIAQYVNFTQICL